MNDQINEKISTFLDNELDAGDIRNLLDSLERNDPMRDTWGRYHLIGDVIRGEGVRITAAGVADRVRAELADQPAIIAAPPQPPSRHRQAPWVRPAAGAALAASVAALAVITIPRIGISPQSGAPRVASAPQQISPPPAQLASLPAATPAPARPASGSGGTRWMDLSRPGVASRLNRYLVDHNEYASAGNVNGVLPYTAFVSYDAGRP